MSGQTNMFEEFSSQTMGKLKDYLSMRGLSCSGTKPELVSRCFVAWENKTELKFSEKQLASTLQTEYQQRLKQAKLSVDPRSIEGSKWISNCKNWPKLDLGKIFSFVLSKKEQDMEFIGQYKTQKAFSYFKSGFVDTVFTCTDFDNITLLKSQVTPSQSVRNDPHDVWISVDEDNNILACWCSCIAGMAQTCNHAIAVGYKIEQATYKSDNDPSCTDLNCEWNHTKKVVQPDRICKMTFQQDNRNKESGAAREDPQINKEYKLNFDPRREDQRQTLNSEIQGLYNSIYQTKSSVVLFTGFPKHSKNTQKPLNILDMAENFITTNESGSSKFLESISLTPEQSICIENNTRGQNNNPYWVYQRKGRVTASVNAEISSKMDNIVKKKTVKTTPLISKILGDTVDLSHVEAVKYGQTNETTARNLFSVLEAKNHNSFKVSTCGLFVKPDRSFISASPDATTSCKCCSNAVVEIKCPHSLKDENVETGWKKLDYLECDASGNITLKASHRHYTQLQTQMAVTGYKVGYFMVYSPKGSMYMKVSFDSEYWLKLQEKLCNFYKAYVIPYLLHEKTLAYCPICEKVCCEEKEITNDEDNSILCESCDLWHHWKCVNVSTNKMNSWVCKDCLFSALD